MLVISTELATLTAIDSEMTEEETNEAQRWTMSYSCSKNLAPLVAYSVPHECTSFNMRSWIVSIGLASFDDGPHRAGTAVFFNMNSMQENESRQVYRLYVKYSQSLSLMPGTCCSSRLDVDGKPEINCPLGAKYPAPCEGLNFSSSIGVNDTSRRLSSGNLW